MNLRTKTEQEQPPKQEKPDLGLLIDLENAIYNPRTDNYTCLLIRLMLKADPINFEKLKRVYPREANTVKLWLAGKISLNR